MSPILLFRYRFLQVCNCELLNQVCSAQYRFLVTEVSDCIDRAILSVQPPEETLAFRTERTDYKQPVQSAMCAEPLCKQTSCIQELAFAILNTKATITK